MRLPAIPPEEKRPPVATARQQVPVPPRRILVVDDNRDSATSLSMLLKVAGNHTFTAFNGHEALHVVKESCPDVVLLDIGLPDLNGYEVARQLRAQRSEKRPTLVALTGWGQDADREKSKRAGFDAAPGQAGRFPGSCQVACRFAPSVGCVAFNVPKRNEAAPHSADAQEPAQKWRQQTAA